MQQFLRKALHSRISALRTQDKIEKQYPYILLFHRSGLTSRQWRQIKNILCTIKGKTLFKRRKNPNQNRAQLASGRAGPTCILYFTKANTWSQLLPPASFHSQNYLVLLYGQNNGSSTVYVFNHMDMEKATTSETSVFQQLLGFMFLPGACLLFLVEHIQDPQ
nr:ribosomal protein L10 [Pellia epiphylla]